MSLSFTKDQIEEVLQKTRIENILGDYISLKPSGKRFMGVCPFHGDKDPSLSVNPEKGLWYCFGCSEGGNVFTFVSKIENVDFNDALLIVARKSGIPLAPRDVKITAATAFREKLMNLVKEAIMFYNHQLESSDSGKHALLYLKKRNILPEYIKLFKIGYAPKGKINALYYLKSKGYTPEDAIKAGIVLKRHDDGELVDYFRHRIVFPITDSQGRFIAIGGREFEEGTGPKYLNSPETEIFSKSRTLFGLSYAKKSIGQEDEAIVVEGYIDQIQLFQQGIHNVVASMGTNLTPEQAKLMRKFCSTCILAYDSDSAGRMATARGVAIFEESGIIPKVLLLPDGEDPDSLVRKTSAAHFRELLKDVKELVEYEIIRLKEENDINSADGKAAFVNGILSLIKEIKDPFKRDVYIKRVSEESGINEDIIRKSSFGRNSMLHPQIGTLQKIISNLSIEEKLLKIMMNNPESISKVRQSVNIADINDKTLWPVFETLFASKSDKSVTVSDFSSYIDNEGILNKITKLIMEGDATPYSEELIDGYVQKIKDEKLKLRFKKLEKEVEELLSQNNMDHNDERFIEYQRLCQYFKGSK